MSHHDPITQKSRARNLEGLFTKPLVALMASAFLAGPVYGQGFGTLFTSPEEREYLDYLRDDFVQRSQSASFNIQEDVIPDIPIVEEETEQEVTIYNFGGAMTSQNGNRQVWLNGRQVAESDLPSNIRLVETAAGTLLAIRNSSTTFQLKAGQTFNSEVGNVQENYQGATTDQDTPGKSALTSDSTQAASTVVSEESASSEINNEDESGLEQILQTLGVDNETASESQLQQALEILSELSDSPQ